MQKTLKFLLFLLFIVKVHAQNVGIGTTSPVNSAQLEVRSTSRGFLPPRMDTDQRNAIFFPADGLIIYNTTTKGLEIKTSLGWISLTASSADALPTIQIGTQKWMSKNLEVAFYRNGDPIPQVTDPIAWAGLTTGAWCYYKNDSTVGTTYGKLYNWYAVNDPRGLAPTGWHIPSDAEWTTLETTLGGSSVAGGKMKEAGLFNWKSNKDGNNNSGFTGLPGGYRFNSGEFYSSGIEGYWWSSTGSTPVTTAWNRNLTYSSGIVVRYNDNKLCGFSVRCLRD